MKTDPRIERIVENVRYHLARGEERQAGAFARLTTTALRNQGRPVDESALRVALGKDAEVIGL